MNIGIIGSRRRDTDKDLRLVRAALRKVYRQGDTLVSGGCKKGGDRFAEILSKELGADIQIYYPDKVALDPRLLNINPRAAYAVVNYARNTLIAGAADILIACVAADRKGGTEDTIKKFRKFHPDGKIILV